MLEIMEVLFEEGDIYLKVFSVIVAVIFVIADWRIHTKAGEKGWIALIPIYNVYSFYKIVWKGSAFWYGVIIEITVTVLGFTAEQSGFKNPVINVIIAVLLIINTVYVVYTNYRASKAFGHGVGLTLGLTFLYGIFILIISFGRSKYVGRNTYNRLV